MRKLLLILPLLLVGCHTSKEASAPAEDATFVSRRALSYEEQRRFDHVYLEAVRQKQLEHYDAQYELLRYALEINPDASEAVYEMALLKLAHASSSHPEYAREGDSLLHRAYVLEPSNRDIRATLAEHSISVAKYGEAIELYEKMVEDKATEERLMQLVHLYEANHQQEKAIATLDRLERQTGSEASISLEKFQLYNQLGDTENAYATIENLCATHQNDLRYRVLLGDLYLQNGYRDMAYAIYKDVITAEPDNTFAQLSLLSYYQRFGPDSLYQQRITDVVLNPNTANTARTEVMRAMCASSIRHNNVDSVRIMQLFQEGLAMPQSDRSLAELYAQYIGVLDMPLDSMEMPMRTILYVDPDYSPARMQLLQILLMRNDAQEGIRICQDGQVYESGNLTYYLYEAICHHSLDNDEEALEATERGIARIDNKSEATLAAGLYAMKGDLMHDKGNDEATFDAYEKAIQWDNNDLGNLNNYAYYLSLRGVQLEKAESMSRRTVEAAPMSDTYLDTYAWILYQQRRYQEAREYIDRVLSIIEEPVAEDATLFEHAGDIYFRCNLRTQAVKHWQRALQLTTDKQQKQKLQRKIRNKRL